MASRLPCDANSEEKGYESDDRDDIQPRKRARLDDEIMRNKNRFIFMVVNGEIELRMRKKAELLKELHEKGFRTMSELSVMAGLEGEEIKPGYDYLLGMNLWSLTYEKVAETTTASSSAKTIEERFWYSFW